MRRFVWTLVLAAATVPVVGCGGGTDATNESPPDGSKAKENDGPSGTGDDGGQAVSDDATPGDDGSQPAENDGAATADGAQPSDGSAKDGAESDGSTTDGGSKEAGSSGGADASSDGGVKDGSSSDGASGVDATVVDAGGGGVDATTPDASGVDATVADAGSPPPLCPTDLATCSSDGGSYCANTSTDNDNCGACGSVCTSGNVCNGGHCIVTCGALTTCTPDGGAPYCANTNTDNANCGTCGSTCPSGYVCGGGVCSLTCGSLTTCIPDGGVANAYCANTSTDQSNCGTCGTVCAAGQACGSGSCTATCGPGEKVCGNSCTNTTFDPANCGSCGNACTYPNASGACSSNTCSLAACSTGYGDCNHIAADGCESNSQTDANNCGACGNRCALGESCQSGSCTFTFTSGLIGYWAFEDTPGSTSAKDSSSNNLPSTIVTPFAFVPGQGKQGTGAGSFTGGYVDVSFPNDADNQGTGAFMPTGNVTYAMWFKTSASAVQGLQVVWGAAFNDGNGYTGWDRVIGNGSPGPLQYNVWSELNPSGTAIVTDGAWHHVAYVLDKSAGMIAYVDGVLDMTDTGSTGNCGLGCSGFNWASDYLIGTGQNGRFGALAFTGLIDEVRVYNIPLSASEVQQLYQATK